MRSRSFSEIVTRSTRDPLKAKCYSTRFLDNLENLDNLEILQDGWWLRHGLDELGVICEAQYRIEKGLLKESTKSWCSSKLARDKYAEPPWQLYGPCSELLVMDGPDGFDAAVHAQYRKQQFDSRREQRLRIEQRTRKVAAQQAAERNAGRRKRLEAAEQQLKERLRRLDPRPADAPFFSDSPWDTLSEEAKAAWVQLNGVHHTPIQQACAAGDRAALTLEAARASGDAAAVAAATEVHNGAMAKLSQVKGQHLARAGARWDARPRNLDGVFALWHQVEFREAMYTLGFRAAPWAALEEWCGKQKREAVAAAAAEARELMRTARANADAARDASPVVEAELAALEETPVPQVLRGPRAPEANQQAQASRNAMVLQLGERVGNAQTARRRRQRRRRCRSRTQCAQCK